MSEPAPSRHFDRELPLAELLTGVPLAKLEAALGTLAGGCLRLRDTGGRVMLGDAAADLPARAPLRLELEEVGGIEAATDSPALHAAARLLEVLLATRALYLMASDLHVEAVRADYEELSRRHRALEESEARYRALNEALEQRVQEQVTELERQQRQLYQAEKLASIGQLAAGVAHEINNPIGFIRSNLATSGGYLERLNAFSRRLHGAADVPVERAWRELDLDFVLSDFADLLRESIDGVDRVARIVRDLKGFSNIDRPDEEVVDLNENLRAVCAVVAGQLPHGVRLDQSFRPVPRLLCLPGHLNQVFVNLLLNAVQAVGSEGEIRIESERVGDAIRVRITDTGQGISPEILPRIFDPFFTTREVGQGTGLGLTVARDIVRAHDGSIEAASTPGAGSVFTVLLPV